MDKFTLFELHVHDGMEFSAMNTASPFGRSSDDDEFEEELEEFLEEMDDGEEMDGEMDEEMDGGGSSGPSALGLVFLLVVVAAAAIAFRKFRGSDDDIEISELDDFGPEYDEKDEAEH